MKKLEISIFAMGAILLLGACNSANDGTTVTKNRTLDDQRYDYLLSKTFYDERGYLKSDDEIELFDTLHECINARDMLEPARSRRVGQFRDILGPITQMTNGRIDLRGTCNRKSARIDTDRVALNGRLGIAYDESSERRESRYQTRVERERDLYNYVECVNKENMQEYEVWTGKRITLCESLPL